MLRQQPLASLCATGIRFQKCLTLASAPSLFGGDVLSAGHVCLSGARERVCACTLAGEAGAERWRMRRRLAAAVRPCSNLQLYLLLRHFATLCDELALPNRECKGDAPDCSLRRRHTPPHAAHAAEAGPCRGALARRLLHLCYVCHCDSAGAAHGPARAARDSTTTGPMAGSPAWLEWLSGLFPSLQEAPPTPGTHKAILEDLRVGGMLTRAVGKPPGQRDEELVHTLSLEYRKRQLENLTVRRRRRQRRRRCFNGRGRQRVSKRLAAPCLTPECLHI